MADDTVMPAASASVVPAESTAQSKADDGAPTQLAVDTTNQDVGNQQSPTKVSHSGQAPALSTNMNGHSSDAVEAADTTQAPASPPPTSEIKSPEQDASATATVPATSTPASGAKKTANGSAKKKTGVPEHRSRKSSKKKTKPALRTDAKPGVLFLARLKGHQPWPSIISDEDMLPGSILQTRPVTAPQPDGTFKKPEFAEGGKREHERTFPVMFLYTNEFAWILNEHLTPITPAECGEAAEKQKSKTLTEAYKVAAEGHDLAHFKQLLLEHQNMLNAEAEAKAEREAKKADKATKQKRKSNAGAGAGDEDKMDLDEDPETKTKTKKRKKEAGADDNEKPAKTPKTGTTKLKLNMTPKTPASEASKKKTPKTKSTTKKSSAMMTGSDDDDAPKQQDEVLTPAQIREKKEKEVRYIRHKLQKGFLSRDTVPGEDEIETMSNYLSKIEAHPDLESSILRATKIHKVLKAMIRLDSIPKDEDFQFKKRSRELLDKWNKTLALDPSANEKEDDGKADAARPKTGDESTEGEKSGVAKTVEEDKHEEPKVETPTAGANEGKTEMKDEVKTDAASTENPHTETTVPKAAEVDEAGADKVATFNVVASESTEAKA